MPRGKRISLDVLSLLPADRRQAVVEEALNSRIRGIFQKHSRATLGRLISGLVEDEHWGVMKNVRVETVLRPSGGVSVNGAPRRGRPPGKPRYSPAALDKLVETIRRRPGLRSEQIQRETGLPAAVAKAGLAELRKAGRVRTSGQRRSTAYSLA